jgi:hypothetical protein
MRGVMRFRRVANKSLPGFSMALCRSTNPHFAALYDKNGKWQRWIPWPSCVHAQFYKAILDWVRLARRIGLIDPVTAQAIHDTRRSPDHKLIARALRQVLVHVEKHDQPEKEACCESF